LKRSIRHQEGCREAAGDLEFFLFNLISYYIFRILSVIMKRKAKIKNSL